MLNPCLVPTLLPEKMLLLLSVLTFVLENYAFSSTTVPALL